MCGSTCFGRLSAHHQEHATTLGASGFTVEEKRLDRCWSWSGRLLVQLYANDDGRGDTRNMLSHTQSSSNKLVKLLLLVDWIIWIAFSEMKVSLWRCRFMSSGLHYFRIILKLTICFVENLSWSIQNIFILIYEWIWSIERILRFCHLIHETTIDKPSM
jgi:hypothetical protein